MRQSVRNAALRRFRLSMDIRLARCFVMLHLEKLYWEVASFSEMIHSGLVQQVVMSKNLAKKLIRN